MPTSRIAPAPEEGLDLNALAARDRWFIVKGTTGSGKTYFVEMIKLAISANNYPVVYVPQFPIFKPQLKVAHYVGMMPLSKDGKEYMRGILEKMDVKATGLVGGKLMGMLELPGLSGGDRKKLLLATALAMAKEFQCPFIVLDEPFAGIDELSMPSILEVMHDAEEGVLGLTYIIVTHDYLHTLSKKGTLFVVQDRVVTVSEDQICGGNVKMGQALASGLLSSAVASPKSRPWFHFYVVKRHFVEQEFVQPLFAGALFGCLLGSCVVNYEGGLPGPSNKSAMYIFMKCFMYDYPNFGNLLNYCFKRAQHMEDYYLNITASRFAVPEILVIVLIQGLLLVAVCNICMCGISGFWFLGWDSILLDYAFILFDTTFFLMIPIIIPNPMIANFALLPYAISVMIWNGILLEKEYFWPVLEWAPYISTSYHMGCAYTEVTDEIKLPQSECQPLALHLVFLNPFVYFITIAVIVKVILIKREQRKLRALTVIAKDAAKVGERQNGKKNESQVTPLAVASPDGTMVSQREHKLEDMDAWVKSTSWWLLKGPTGSGKTYFVEQLMLGISARGKDFVYVPQYPMYKPQLGVMQFVNLLPLSKETRAEMLASMEEMEVPTKGLIGGSLYGMLTLPGLSGGQRKKFYVALSVAVAKQYQCQYIIMDEPFAGINEASMKAVVAVMQKASAVSGLKVMIVTHDHFDMLAGASTSSILQCVDRTVVSDNGFAKPNGEAAGMFIESMVAAAAGSQGPKRPLLDLYVIKRYFLEQEFGFPLMAYVIFGVLLGLVVTEYNDGLPGYGYDVAYVFLKGFALEFPHFGSIINYCFKRSQHMEDFYLGITRSKYSVAELVIISVIQATVLVPLFTAILCGICSFWWVNIDVSLCDYWYEAISTIGYFLLPLVCPNPILAMACILPNVCVWGFTNGVIFPTDDMWVGTRWTAYFSTIYNLSCAYKEVSDGKLVYQGTNCLDSLPLHLFLSCTFTWVVMLALLIKVLLKMRKPSKGA